MRRMSTCVCSSRIRLCKIAYNFPAPPVKRRRSRIRQNSGARLRSPNSGEFGYEGAGVPALPRSTMFERFRKWFQFSEGFQSYPGHVLVMIVRGVFGALLIGIATGVLYFYADRTE